MNPSHPVRRAGKHLPGLTTQILAAFVLGGFIGWLWPEFGRSLQLLATIFVRLIMVIIAPLIFSTLVTGIAGSGEFRKLGKLALQTVVYILLLTFVVLALGFFLANTLEPGGGVDASAEINVTVGEPPTQSFWVRIVPRSIVDAMARGDVLQIVIFSLLFGVALGAAGEKGRPVLNFTRSLSEVMFKFTGLVMKTAPLGVLGAAAAMVGSHGLAVGKNFLWYILTVYLGLAILAGIIYPVLCLVLRIPLRPLFHAIKEPFAIAFATTSSAAALPTAMENMERFGAPRRVTSFVLPLATGLNLAGSALFIAVASIFLLQVFQIPFSFKEQMVLFGTLFVATKGVANVPRASLVVIAAGLTAMNVPPETIGAGIGLLLGVDPIVDMPRTGVNTAGNCIATAVMARLQGNLQPAKTQTDKDMPASSL